MFLVGAFSFREKARLLRWLVFFLFFRQTTDRIVYVPLFTDTDKLTQAKSGQCKLCAKGLPFHFLPFLRNLQNRKRPKDPPFQFYWHCAKVFSKIFQCLKRVPPSSFLIFCNSMLLNPKGSPPLHFSALCDIFRKKKVRSLLKFFLFLVWKK